jgi:hypothetical protein
MKAKKYVLILSILIAGQLTLPNAWGQDVVSGGGSSLLYKNKVSGKPDEFKSISFLKNGEQFVLFSPQEGITYAPAAKQSGNLSQDEAFFFVNKFDSGTATSGDGQNAESSNSSCVFVETKTACVVYQGAGDMCDGHWQGAHDWIPSSGDQISIGKDRPSIIPFMKSYEHVKGKVKLSDVLADTHIDNLLRCDPVDQNNKPYYEEALKNLDGDKIDQDLLKKALSK